MPDFKRDSDQLRFSQIRSRMLDTIASHCSQQFMQSAGVDTRAALRNKLMESPSVLELIECCAYAAQCIEEERKSERTLRWAAPFM